jgi:hypothetical protein
MRAAVLIDPADVQPQASSELEPGHSPEKSNDPIRMVLIGLVAVLSITLAGVSYARFANDGSRNSAAAIVTTTITEAPDPVSNTDAPDPVSNTEAPDPVGTTEPRATTSASAITTTAAPQTTEPPASTTTTAPGPSKPPSPPQDVAVFSTSSTGAEIRWRSEECVGSRYRVGDFDEGSGGYPNVPRCWFNHVILAGNPSFSPPLTPNTSYTVTIQAVSQDGATSEPVLVQFTTTS